MDRTNKGYYEFPNHNRIKMERMGKFVNHMPHKIYLGSKKNLPPGSGSFFLPVRDSEISINLRENQKEVFNSIKDVSSGLIEAKTGFGKSVLALSLCEYWGNKTLIVLHTADMVRQFHESFQQFYGKGFTEGKVGRYGGGKKELNTITLTTTKSFAMFFDEFQDYGFNNLIRDEADFQFSEAQRNAICDFPCQRTIGMTGTIYKEEFDDYLNIVPGDEPALVRFYGHHVKAVQEEEEVLKGINYKIHKKEYIDDYGIPYLPQSDWVLFREKLDGDMERKKAMAEYISNNTNVGEHVLVLFDRVDDTELFAQSFKNVRPELNINICHGTVKNRDENIASFKKDGGILFAQEKTAGRGFDVPKCEKIFILFPSRKENSLRQMVGRVIRKATGKESYVYDWIDSSLQHQWKQRKKVYKEIFDIDPIPTT